MLNFNNNFFLDTHVSNNLYLNYDYDYLTRTIEVPESKIESYKEKHLSKYKISTITQNGELEFINTDGKILDGEDKSFHISTFKMASLYAHHEYVNFGINLYKAFNTRFDDMKFLLNSIRLISAEHGNIRSNILLNNKSISTFTKAKYKSYDEHLELVNQFNASLYSITSHFDEIRKKSDLEFFDFQYSKIIEHVQNMKDLKKRKQYLFSINELMISNIDILVDGYFAFLNIANMNISKKKIEKSAIISKSINNFQNCEYSKEFTNDSLNIKLLNLGNEYQKVIDLQVQEEVLEKETTITVDASPITFIWKGTELELIEIVHLLIESKILYPDYPPANKANQGKKAAYKAIFDFFNKELKNDPTSRVGEITSRNKPIISQKVGASTKPVGHNFQVLHKIIPMYLKNYVEKPQ